MNELRTLLATGLFATGVYLIYDLLAALASTWRC